MPPTSALTKTSVISVVNTYLRRSSPDRISVIEGDKTKFKLRAELTTRTDLSEKGVLIKNVKKPLNNPYFLAKLEKLTEVQKFIRDSCKNNYIKQHGSIAIEASCGSGKTLAALYLLYYFKCKVLIISTRNAVLDQWGRTISQLYPQLVVQTNERKIFNDEADIWIMTPQYMNNKNRVESKEELDIHPGLIIYDEIHTMISETKGDHDLEFLNVLKYPFIRCINKEWTELPYMLALSATYPEKSRVIERIFGCVYETIDTSPMAITRIPIHICDMRDFQASEHRQKCDAKYEYVGEISTIEFYIDHIQFKRGDENVNTLAKRDIIIDKLVPDFQSIQLSNRNQGIVMLSKIDLSVWAALFIHQRLHCDVLLVRTSDEESYYLPKDQFMDFKFTKSITLDEFKKAKIGIPTKDYRSYLDRTEVIVSTISRMKEGFSNEAITWGIVSQFPYSQSTRVQIAGRIRRSSKDPELNKAKRYLYVGSSKVPSTQFTGGKYNPYPEVVYSWKFENDLFKKENIIYISKHAESDL